jgi:hypothetical protein
MAVVHRLFASVMPEKAAEIFETPPAERWAGQVAEDIAQLRRKLEQKDRRLA